MSFFVEEFLDLIERFFSTVFDWLFGFLFGTIGGSFINLGKNAYSAAYGYISSSIRNGQFLYIILGAIVGFSLIRIVIRIIRG